MGQSLLRSGWVLQPQGCAFCFDLFFLPGLPVHAQNFPSIILKTVFPLSLIRTRTSLFFPTSQSTKGEVSCLPWALPVAEQIELELCALPRRRKFSGACWEASRAPPLFCGWCCMPQGHSCWGTCLHLQTQSEWQLPIFQLGRLRAGTGKTRVF